MKHFKPIEISILKRKAIGSNQCWRGQGRLAPRCTGGWHLKWCSCCGQPSGSSSKSSTESPDDPATPLLGKSPKELKMRTPTDTCTAAPFKMLQDGSTTNTPQQMMNKQKGCIHIMKNYPAFQKNETMLLFKPTSETC